MLPRLVCRTPGSAPSAVVRQRNSAPRSRDVPSNGGRRLARVDLEVAGPQHPAHRILHRCQLADRVGTEELGTGQLAQPGFLEQRELVLGARDDQRARPPHPQAGALGQSHPALAGEFRVLACCPGVDARADMAEVAHARADDRGRSLDDHHSQPALDRGEGVPEAHDPRTDDREVELVIRCRHRAYFSARRMRIAAPSISTTSAMIKSRNAVTWSYFETRSESYR